MTTHLELARSVRAEHIRRYAEARSNSRRTHRSCAAELSTLQAVTVQELKLCVRASQPSLLARAAAIFNRRAT